MKFLFKGVQFIAIVLIRIYQGCLSPFFPQKCRHEPSCSYYAIECIKGHGVLKGAFLLIKRLLKCHPWGTKGYDPVPPVSQ